MRPSACLMSLSKPRYTCELTPCNPTVPERAAIQPGDPRSKYQGSLEVMLGGGAISFGSISIGPAFTAPTIAKSAPAKKSNFIFIGGFCARQSSVLRKLLALVDPHYFARLAFYLSLPYVPATGPGCGLAVG